MGIIYFEDILENRERKIDELFEQQLDAVRCADVDLAIELAIDIKKAKRTWTDKN